MGFEQVIFTVTRGQGPGPPQTPWHPSAIAPLVLDADTLTGTNGSSVASWTSTGSNTTLVATQSLGANYQPVLSLGAQNGKNVVTSPSSGLGRFMTVPSMPFRTDTAVGFVGLFNSVVTSFGMMMVLGNPGTWETRESGSTVNWEFFIPAGTLSPGKSFVGWHVIASVKRANDTAYVYTDGALTPDATLAAPYASNKVTTPQDFTIGSRPAGTFSFQGDMAAVVVVDADLADSDRQKIEGWLANKWGLTSLLPAGHPYRNSPP